jgi:predicted DNA-binding transcriptional regulator AlpA
VPERLLTVTEVAEQLGVRANWVHSHASGKRRPLLVSLKVGKYRRFRAADIEQFLALCAALARDMVAKKQKPPRRVA